MTENPANLAIVCTNGRFLKVTSDTPDDPVFNEMNIVVVNHAVPEDDEFADPFLDLEMHRVHIPVDDGTLDDELNYADCGFVPVEEAEHNINYIVDCLVVGVADLSDSDEAVLSADDKDLIPKT